MKRLKKFFSTKKLLKLISLIAGLVGFVSAVFGIHTWVTGKSLPDYFNVTTTVQDEFTTVEEKIQEDTTTAHDSGPTTTNENVVASTKPITTARTTMATKNSQTDTMQRTTTRATNTAISTGQPISYKRIGGLTIFEIKGNPSLYPIPNYYAIQTDRETLFYSTQQHTFVSEKPGIEMFNVILVRDNNAYSHHIFAEKTRMTCIYKTAVLSSDLGGDFYAYPNPEDRITLKLSKGLYTIEGTNNDLHYFYVSDHSIITIS